MRKLMLFLLVGMFLISLVSTSETFLGTFAQGDCIDLTQTCPDCTYNNITSIKYPNGTKYLFNPEQNMTQTGTDFNFYTCDFSSEIGDYVVNGHGDDDGTDDVWNYKYEITASGQSITEGKTLGGIGILFSVFAVSLFFLFIGFKLSSNDKTLPIGFFFSVMAIFLIIYSLHLGWIFSVNILQDEVLSQGVSTVFLTVLWGSSGIAIIFFVFMFVAFVKELSKMAKVKKFGEDFNPINDTYDY